MHLMSQSIMIMVRVRLIQSADHETKDSYTFDVTASDGELSDTKSVTVNVTDVEEDEGPLK